MSEKYLITGASGFIGSAIVRQLLSLDHEVYSLVRPESNLWRLPDSSPQHHLIGVDLTDLPDLKKIVTKIRPTHIFHLATYGVYRDQNDPELINRNNIIGTKNLLDVSRDLDLVSLINTGSVYEYSFLPGKRLEGIVGKPRNPYDQAKIASTKMASEFALIHSMPICTLRLFTTYGPYEDIRRLVPKVITSFLRNEIVTVSPGPIRDFIYLDDVVSAYLSAASLAPRQGEVINIGSGQPVRVGELVNDLIGIIQPKKLPHNTDLYAPANDSCCWADISQAKQLLSWQPRTSLHQGLTQTVNWFKQNQHLY